MLEHHGACLPSFAALPAAQQRSVRFTQSKMGFNHGWLVQAEAPPGALFGKFKAAIASDGVAASDVAFYFVHWLTDLAGAVPSPLEGSEKFVLKFPQPVLGSFISSFSVVNELAHKTETQVMGRHCHCHYHTPPSPHIHHLRCSRPIWSRSGGRSPRRPISARRPKATMRSP